MVKGQEGKRTCVDLTDLRQGQSNFISVRGLAVGLQRVGLEVDGLQLFFVLELPFDFLEAGQFVRRGPELLQVYVGLQVLQVRDTVVGDVQDAELGVGGQSTLGDGGDAVVGDIEFFELRDGGEVGNGSEAVGFKIEYLEIDEWGEILHGRYLILAEPQLF